MNKKIFSKSTIVILVIICFLLVGCNFLKGVIPGTDNTEEESINSPDLGGITEFVEQEVLIKIKPGANIEKIVSAVGGTIIETLPQISVIRIKLASGVTVAESINTLEVLKEVEYAEPNGICYMHLAPNDLDYDSQWAPQLTGAESAWDVTTGDNSIVIAVTDTGVDGTHPDFGGKVIAGYDTYNNIAILANTDSSVQYHGTHCAGIAAAVGNNNQGMAGVAWGSKIMPIKICGDGPDDYSASNFDMAEAFIWAADNGTDVISCSFGGKGYSQTMKDAIDYAVIDNGCVMVASMGNSHCDEIMYPAGYQSVIAVGATDAHDEIASFSTTGNHMSVCAPGVEIYSTMPGGEYDYLSGTSMSCPFVAGAAALILSQNLGMSPEGVKTQLEETAVDLGSPGFDSVFGYGRVDLAAVVGAVGENKYGVVDVLVNDQLGNPLPGASVILWQGGTVISTTNSNEDGQAKFEYIQAGEYGISVSFPGFDSCLAADNPVTVVAGSSVSKTVAFTTAIEIKPKVSDISAYAITLQAVSSTSSSINISEFQNKISQLEEKGILKPSYMFDNGSKRLTKNSTSTAYTINVRWHSYYEATGYRVYKSVNGASYILLIDWEAPTGYNWYGFYDWEVIPGNNYAYYIIAYGCGWKTDMSEIVTIDTFLPPCSLISPLNGATITKPNPVFRWSPVGVSSFPYGSIYYKGSDLWVYDYTAEETAWYTWFNDMITSIATYNQNGQAFPLVSGHDYLWDSGGYGFDKNGDLIAMSWSEDWVFTYNP
ncbi:S8 family serine peptidase [bacterium]|nr:S8 family serine peptidase [bacterium]